MGKRPKIDLGSLKASAEPPISPIAKLEAKESGKAPSRAKLVQVSAFVAPETRTELKLVAVRKGTTLNALLEEAIEEIIKMN